MKNLIIDVRINEYALRDDNPNVPYSPEEIANQALECWREGASILHYHARAPKTGAPSADVEHYAEVARRVKDKSDMLIFPTLGAWTLPTPEARIAHIVEMAKDPQTKPDLAPLDMGTSNVDMYDPTTKRFQTDEMVYVNTTKTLRYFTETLKTAGVKPMQGLWNISSIRTTQAFVEMGLFQEPLYMEIGLTEGGILAGHPGTVKGMQAFLDFLPSNLRCEWGVVCYGGNLLPLVGAAVERGGHIAIGLGDYPYPEMEAPTNAQLISRVARMAREMGRQVATPAETRQALGLV